MVVVEAHFIMANQCTMDQSSFLFGSLTETSNQAMELIEALGNQITNRDAFVVSPSTSLPTLIQPPALVRESTQSALQSPRSAPSSDSTEYENSTRDDMFAQFSDLVDQKESILDDESALDYLGKLAEKNAEKNYLEAQIGEQYQLVHSSAQVLTGWLQYMFDEKRVFKNRQTGRDILFHGYSANVVQYTDGLADVTFHNVLTETNISFVDEVAVMHLLMSNHANRMCRLINKPFLSLRKFPGNHVITVLTAKLSPKASKNEVHFNVPVYFWPRLSQSRERVLDWHMTLHYPPN